MKGVILFWLAAWAGVSLSLAKPVGKLIDAKTCRDYTIRIYRDQEDTGQGSFEICKGSKTIYETKGFLFEIWHGTTSEGKQVPLIGEDITLIGNPQVVIWEWTGGMHCCDIARIYSLGEKAELLATINATHSEKEPVFQQTSPDLPWSVRLHDWTFAYWPGCFATSPAPEIILKWDGMRYIIDKERMKKPAPIPDAIAKLAEEIRTDKWTDHDGCPQIPQRLYSTALDLIYSGHENLGWNFLRLAWKPNFPGYAEFAASLRKRLEQSPYWSQLK